jgi:streptogramin lyase
VNDFDDRLKDALKNATSDYRPSDPYEAKARFMSRFRRRRIALYGGSVALAGAAAIAAFLLLPEGLTSSSDELPPATQVPLRELSIVDVGDDPSGIAFGSDAVWVASRTAGTVQVIDPLSNEVTDVHRIGGSPDDVAVGLGAAWASDSSSGTITKIGFDGSVTEIPVGEPGKRLEAAPGSGAVWVVSDGDALYRIDPVTDALAEVPTPEVEGISDVAAGQGRVIVLGTNVLASVDPLTEDVEVISEVAASGNQDLQMSEGAVWVADGDAGEVTRFDLATGEPAAPVYVGGNFTAIASGEDAMWMLSGDEGVTGNLTRIDPETSEIVGKRVSIGGRPIDVTTGAGSVWVVNTGSKAVVRLDPNALPGTKGFDPEQRGRPLYAFSAEGDLFIEDVDGRLNRLTSTPEVELYPTLSADSTQLAFQRGDDAEAEIVIMDLLTDDETVLGEGEGPSFAPDGRLAWVRGNYPGPDIEAELVISRPGSNEEVTIDPIVQPGPSGAFVNNIAWDLPGTYIYYEVSGNDPALFQVDSAGDADPFQVVPGSSKPGTSFLAPVVRGRDSVHVIGVCCSTTVDDPAASVEIAVIRFIEGGPEYSPVIPLRLGGSQGLGENPTLVPAGRMVLAGGSHKSRAYREGRAPSWLVTSARGIWLIDERGEVAALHRLLGLSDYAGLSMAPQFRQ